MSFVDLRWDQIDFSHAVLHVRRAKKGTPATHPVVGDEMRALRKLRREQDPKSPFVFTSERGAPFTTSGFARMVERAGVGAKLGFPAHHHMLRHACGFALANKGHDTRALQAYLGHKNIQHTVRYTELSPDRFKARIDRGHPVAPTTITLMKSRRFMWSARMCSKGSYCNPWSISHQKGTLYESLVVCAPAKQVFDETSGHTAK